MLLHFYYSKTVAWLAFFERQTNLVLDRIKNGIKEVCETGAEHPVSFRLATSDPSSTAVRVSVNDASPVLRRNFDRVVTKVHLQGGHVFDMRAFHLVCLGRLQESTAKDLVINVS